MQDGNQLVRAGVSLGVLATIMSIAGSFLVSTNVRSLQGWSQAAAALLLVLGALLGRLVTRHSMKLEGAERPTHQSFRRAALSLPVGLGVVFGLALAQILPSDNGSVEVGVGLLMVVVGAPLTSFLSAIGFAKAKLLSESN